MASGTHPKVTLRKVRNTLMRSGLSASAQSSILKELNGAAYGGDKPISIKRPTMKKIGTELALNKSCGLYLNRNGVVVVVSGKFVSFRNFEIGRKNLKIASDNRREASTQEVALAQ